MIFPWLSGGSAIMNYLWIGLGSALGGMTRYGVARVFGQLDWAAPWATFFVNASGSFLIGLIAGMHAAESRLTPAPGIRDFLMIGVLGGYTTFSSFSLQTLQLAQRQEWMAMSLNVGGSVVCCLVAVWGGSWVGRQF